MGANPHRGRKFYDFKPEYTKQGVIRLGNISKLFHGVLYGANFEL